MKKSSIAIAIIGVLAVAYPAASWMTGRKLEIKLAQSKGAEASFGNFKVIQKSYQRGVFSSTQTSTLELRMPNLPSRQQVAAEKPLQLEMINHIQHGPMPGVFGIAAGKITTEFVLDERAKMELKKTFGEKKFLDIRTLLKYDGSGNVSISSPAVITNIGAQDKLDWKGLTVDIGFDPGYKKLRFNFLMPGFDASMKDGSAQLKLGELKMTGEAERAYPDSMIYLGKTVATISSLAFSNKQATSAGFSLEKLNIESDSSMKNDMLDVALKFGIDKISLNYAQFTNFHYDYSVTNIHAPTFNTLLKDIATINQNVPASQLTEEMLTSWKNLGMDFLRHNPVLSLDRMSLRSKSGDFNLSAKMQFVGITEADVDVPNLLMSKLESSMNVSFVEALFIDVIDAMQSDLTVRRMMTEKLQTQIAGYEAQGHLLRKDKTLSAQISWKNGGFIVNDQPFSLAPNEAQGAMPVHP